MPPSQRRGGRRTRQDTDLVISRSLHSGAAADVVSVPMDTKRGTPSWNLIERPPVNFQRNIVWLTEESGIIHTLSSSGAVVESNLAPLLSTFVAVSQIASLFDQYCIYAIKARFVLDSQGQGAATALSYGRLHSAIDTDSTTNIGTETGIQRFSSVQSSELVPGKSYERFCKPCVSLVTGSSNSTSNTGIVMTRQWLNSFLTSVPHFGIRFMTVGNQNVSTNTGVIYLSAVIGCRNNI